MSKRRLVIASVSITCLAIIISIWYLHSQQLAEQKLQDHIRRLEDSGFIVQERSLVSFQVDGTARIYYFGDFRSFAEQRSIHQIYVDRGIRALYFLNTIDDRVEAQVFYYG